MKNILYILILFLPILSFCQGVQNDKYYNIATGTNSYTVAINAITAAAPYDGQKILVKFINTNSGASTLVVVSGNGTYSVKDIETTSGTALPSGIIAAGSQWYLSYNSTYNSWETLGGYIPSLANAWYTIGNSGTVAGVNFIGTTDDVDLVFKRNGLQSGLIGQNNNTSFGASSFNPTFTGSSNSAFGSTSLSSLSSGFNNTGFGAFSLSSVTSGTENTSIGESSLRTLITGSANVAIGYSAGYHETGSNKLFIDNSARTSEADARIKSMIYGVFGATVATQSLTINGQLRINDGTGVTGYILTYKSDGFSEWAASASSEWTQSGNDIYNNNSGNVGIGSSSVPFSAKLFVNAGSGIVGQEIATVNTVGLSILSGGGGIDITNTSAGSPALNIYSDASGITGQSLGDGIDWTAPEMVFKSNNSAVLTANNTTIANSFEDNQTLGAFTSTGNFFQIVSNNASTRNLFVVKKNTAAVDYLTVGSTGKIFGVNTYTVNYSIGGVIKDFFTDVSNGTTVETDLYTYTTPANTLSVNGDKIIINTVGTHTSNGNTKTLKAYFGGTQIANLDFTSPGQQWQLDGWVIRVSSTVVRCMVRITSSSEADQVTQYTEVTGLTLSSTNIIKITGQSSAASADITARGGFIEFKPAAN